jgi:hypothetical protein
MATKIVAMLLGLTLVLLVACGSAAEPTSVPDPTATQAADTAPAVEPTAPVAGETSQPTATPQVASLPGEVEVNPGRVTLLTEQFGTERFDPVFGTIGVDYARQFHGFLISTEVENVLYTHPAILEAAVVGVPGATSVLRQQGLSPSRAPLLRETLAVVFLLMPKARVRPLAMPALWSSRPPSSPSAVAL